MDKQRFDAIRECVLDCAMYFAKGQPDEPTREEMRECVESMNAAEIMELHAQDKEWLHGTLKDDIICSIFRKHGL